MAQIEVGTPVVNGTRTYGKDDDRELADVSKGNNGDGTSYLGEGWFSGMTAGMRNGFLLGAVALLVGGFGARALIASTSHVADDTSIALDTDQLEFLKGRLTLKASILNTLSSRDSYEVDQSGTITFKDDAKEKIKSILVSNEEDPILSKKPEYQALEKTFIDNPKPTKQNFYDSYEAFKVTYKSDWKKISKLLRQIGEGDEIPVPSSFVKFPY